MTIHLPVIPIDSTLFDFNGQTFAAEASTLNGRFSLQRFYDEESDVGIAIRSARTNDILRFSLHHIERGQDEIKAWHFRPVIENEHVNDRVRNLRVVVFND